MIDVHSHILWGVDHGAKSEEMTIAMLKKAIESGTTAIIATPHYYRGYFDSTYDEVKIRVQEARALAKKNNIDIEIYCGQEVYYKREIINYYLDGSIGTINGGKYMLIELPYDDFSVEEVKDSLYELTVRGIVPIIAHPERYKTFAKRSSLINEFIEEGYLFQLNAGAMTGRFGVDAKRLAEKYVKNEIYSFVGSDAHEDKNRTTDMRSGLEQINKINSQYLSKLEENAEKLLKNEEIIFSGSKINKKKKGFFAKIFLNK